MKHKDTRLILLVALTLLVCGVAGGSNFILVKTLVGQVSPLQLVAARVALAAAVLSVSVCVLRRLPRLTTGLVKGAAILALIDAVLPYLLIAWAAPHILASTSALLVSTMPPFTALFVSATDRAKVPGSALLGLMLGALGVSILAGPTALQVNNSSSLAIFAVLLAAASYAAAAVYSRTLLRVTDPIGLSAVKFAIASAVLVPAVALHDGVANYAKLTPMGWLGLLGIGVIVTGLARCGYVWVISAAGSVSASLLTYVIPASALVLGWLFMAESMSWSRTAAVALIAASLTCVLFGRQLVEVSKRWSIASTGAQPAKSPINSDG